MIKLECTEVMNVENAIRGARNPMNSHHRMDSQYDEEGIYVLGTNDLDLARRLCNAGSDHRKFLRQIFISVDITAPLYWWKEYDTYKVGTAANSQSTMHKIHSKPFTEEDFSLDECDTITWEFITNHIIPFLENHRLKFNETKDKTLWRGIIQALPSSYNQMRTCTMTYENLHNMYHSRKNHKLTEWHTFCTWVESLPYSNELITGLE